MDDERIRIEQSIAALDSQRAVLGEEVVDASIAALQAQIRKLDRASARERDRRKQVTVLFADVSGFTAMSEGRDAEEIRTTINALWQRLDAILLQRGGHIDKHMGDSVMALWGAGVAREDDPVRALRAALAMQAEVAAFNEQHDLPEPLQIRVGVNTGPVMLGEVGTQGEYTAIGDTVNTASRLEQAAPVGAVLVSHNTYRHVVGLFDVQDHPPITVKGKAEPVQVYTVLRARPRPYRLITRGVEGVETRMVGRQLELAGLQNSLQQLADSGTSEIITIVGEAGVGKSRLSFEFETWIGQLEGSVNLFKGRASLETFALPHALLRDMFASRFGIQDSDSSRQVTEKLEDGFGSVLGGGSHGQMQAHFIGRLMAFDVGESEHLQTILEDPQQLRDRALSYLITYFQHIADVHPTLILIEDVHWADDSSLGAIRQLTSALAEKPVLFVFLARPSFFERQPQWMENRPQARKMELLPLSKKDSRTLVEEILRNLKEVPVALRELVVSGAEGNPFYLEELIKMLIEEGVVVKDAPYWRVEPTRLAEARVPPTLTGILQARLDSLPALERAVLQRASVVGRTFWESAVVQVGSASQNALQPDVVREALSNLQNRELIFERSTSAFANTPEYFFKHVILREVTYETVLIRDRRVYHREAARWLIENGQDRVNEYAALIGEHYDRASDQEKAIQYFRRAGDQAARAFANKEAVAHYTRALDLLPEDALERRFALLKAREGVYDLLGAREAQHRDIVGLQQMADSREGPRKQEWLAEVALRRANYAEATGDYPGAIEAARTAIEIGGSRADVETEAMGYLHWGRALWRQGSYTAAAPNLENALALARTAGIAQVEADSLRSLGIVSWYLGDYEGAREHYRRALSIYHEIGDRLGESASLNNLGIVCRIQGDYEGAKGYYEQALQIKREIGDRLGEGNTLNNLGGLAENEGDYANARGYLQGALQIFQRIGDRQGVCGALSNLGIVCLYEGDYGEVRSYFREALRISRAIGDPYGEGRALLNLGLACVHLGDYQVAREHLEGALRSCRETGDRGAEGQALAYLSLLAHRLGEDDLAREYSQQALLFPEDTGDLHLKGYALTTLGHALSGLGNLSEAANSYRQSLAIRRESGRLNLVMETLSGLARVALAQNDVQKALTCVEEILQHLDRHTLNGAEEPMRVYLTCIKVLKKAGDGRAEDLLDRASQVLQSQAERLPDDEIRGMFLNNVNAHREILAMAEGE